jgi:hypothetical protein
MELLRSDFHGRFGKIDQTTPPKDFYLCAAPSFRELPSLIHPHSMTFGLLVAVDAPGIPLDEIYKPAIELLQRGLVYMMSWGMDCERVHDIFDEAEVIGEIEGKTPVRAAGCGAMTVCKPKDTLQDAVWFFAHNGIPGDVYAQTTRDWIIAPIGNAALEDIIRNAINKL